MFRKNNAHLQTVMLSSVDALPEKQQRRLAESWAGTFYRELFSRIDESPFAVLYSDKASRPNIPVNVLVALEYLKAGRGWCDEEMQDAFQFDVQVRYALGYRNLGEGAFELRTVYNFRARLSKHMQRTGENLLDQAYAAVTDAQVAAFGLKTDKLRMDSSQIASNIRQMSRLQLLVEVVQRVYRLLNDEEQAGYAADFAPYVGCTAGQYTYRVKYGETAPHIERIGLLMQKLLTELAAAHGETSSYQLLRRVFHEHFALEEAAVRPKQGRELRADSLQAPDDSEATYREKAGRGYKGYVVNATETCEPSNPFQLIIDVQVESNTTDDSVLLTTALPELVERSQVSELYTDGGYNSPAVDAALAEHQVVHVQTAIRGGQADSKRLSLKDFAIETTQSGTPVKLTCPGEQTVAVSTGRTPVWFNVRFDAERCASCPFFGTPCPAKPGKRDPRPLLRFTKDEVALAQRRRRSATARRSGRNLRSAVEATIRSLKLPFNDDQLPVRGRFRVSCMMLGSAAWTNVRRINRYLNTRDRLKAKNGVQNPVVHITTAIQHVLNASFGLFTRLRPLSTSYFEQLPISHSDAPAASPGLPRPLLSHLCLLPSAQVPLDRVLSVESYLWYATKRTNFGIKGIGHRSAA
jgi:hypothetical protein